MIYVYANILIFRVARVLKHIISICFQIIFMFRIRVFRLKMIFLKE